MPLGDMVYLLRHILPDDVQGLTGNPVAVRRLFFENADILVFEKKDLLGTREAGSNEVSHIREVLAASGPNGKGQIPVHLRSCASSFQARRFEKVPIQQFG